MATVNKIGVLVTNLTCSQLNFYCTDRLNKYISKGHRDAFLFYEDLSPVAFVPNFAIMNLVECYSFNGVAIATNISTAAKLIEMPGPTKKYFYVYDLEHNKFVPRQSWEALISIYGNPHLNLITRSKSHQRIIKNCFNRDSILMDDFDINVMEKL